MNALVETPTYNEATNNNIFNELTANRQKINRKIV